MFHASTAWPNPFSQSRLYLLNYFSCYRSQWWWNGRLCVLHAALLNLKPSCRTRILFLLKTIFMKRAFELFVKNPATIQIYKISFFIDYIAKNDIMYLFLNLDWQKISSAFFSTSFPWRTLERTQSRTRLLRKWTDTTAVILVSGCLKQTPLCRRFSRNYARCRTQSHGGPHCSSVYDFFHGLLTHPCVYW